VAASLVLLATSGLLGAIGGRKAKRARRLAEGADEGAEADPRIVKLLGDRLSLAANLGAGAAAVAILVLMVWRP
jgi:uncharacterized membrane protein